VAADGSDDCADWSGGASGFVGYWSCEVAAKGSPGAGGGVIIS